MSRRDEDVAYGAVGPAFGGIAPEMQACPKCRGEMVEGWIPRSKIDTGLPTVSTWQPGVPQGKEVPAFFGHGHLTLPLSENTKQSLPIIAMRCVRCGFLEFYAR